MSSIKPVRLDIALVERKLAKSRTHAKKLIVENKVNVTLNAITILPLKPSTLIDEHTDVIVFKCAEDVYVSRAGLKLEHAINHVNLNVKDAVCLDIGQSTGGFTDCLLQHGAKHVVGIEVGHGQLVDDLINDERVTCLEGVNARNLSPNTFSNSEYSLFNCVVMDVSFISQTLILPNIDRLLIENGYLISLVKPQFEVGKAGVGKKGIVKNNALYHRVQEEITRCANTEGLNVLHYIHSPIAGGDGNNEFLMIAKKVR